MIDPPNWLWSTLYVAFQGQLKTNELAIFVGRLAAWHLVPSSTQLPPELGAPASDESISSERLREAWKQLSETKQLGDRRLAFVDETPFPYEQLSDAAISKANQLLVSVILFDEESRVALADKIVGALRGSPWKSEIGFPLEIADFVIRLIKPKPDERVFCPGPIADALAIAAMKQLGHPVVVSEHAPIAACLYASMCQKNLTVIKENPYRSSAERAVRLEGLTLGAVVPPFNLKLENAGTLGWIPSRFGVRSSEALGVELALRHATDRSAVVVPNRFLFASGSDKTLREHLVNEGILAAVISFSAGLLSNTSLPFTVLFLTPGAKKRIVTFCKVDDDRFVTGSGKVRAHGRRFTGAESVLKLLKEPDEVSCVAVKGSEIQAQEFALTPDRYLIRPSVLTANSARAQVSLGDVVEIVKPQLLGPEEGPSGSEIQEAIPSDMPKYGYLERVNRIRQVDSKLLKVRHKQQLVDGDVLLSTKGTIGTVAIARPDRSSGVPLLPSQASVILRLKKGAEIGDPRYLFMYLRSPVVQQVLTALATGATIKNISLGDLRELPVWVPNAEEQAALVNAFEEQCDAQKTIETLENKQKELSTMAWKSIGLVEML